MSTSLTFKNASLNNRGVAGLALSLALGACAPAYQPSGSLTENPATTAARRSPIQQQDTDCTYLSRETGDIINGEYVFSDTPDGVVRTCVSSPHAEQRQAGTNPLTEINQTVSQVTGTISTVQGLIRSFDQ